LAQRAGEAAALLTRAGIPTEVVQDVEAVVWSKLVLSAAINPLTVLAAGPNGDLVAKAPLRRLLNAVAREAAEVARGRAIRLLWSDPADEAAAVCQRTRDNVSSMLQDVLAGRRTEIDEINGALCSEARRVGVPVPLNEALTRLVREGLASGGEPSAAHCGG
jgi:2-dehydropantoate 2-reductase